MNSIYQIDNQLLSCIDPETGEVLDMEALTSLTIERDRIVEGLALYALELERQADSIGAEVKRLQERQRETREKAARLSLRLGEYLGHEKFKTDLVTVSFRRAEAVEVDPDTELPPEFRRVKYEPDKTAIKAALKAGKEVQGCCLTQNTSTIIR